MYVNGNVETTSYKIIRRKMKILNTDALTGSKFKKAAKKLDFENFKLQLPPTLPFLVKVTFLGSRFYAKMPPSETTL